MKKLKLFETAIFVSNWDGVSKIYLQGNYHSKDEAFRAAVATMEKNGVAGVVLYVKEFKNFPSAVAR